MKTDNVVVDRRTAEQIRRGDIDFNPADPKARSMTQQHFAEEVDINNIVARAIKAGGIDLSVGAAGQGITGDFTKVGDYLSVMNKVALVNSTFEQLPVNLRSRFNNDPGQFVDYLADPKNAEEASNLGLLPKEVGDAIRANRVQEEILAEEAVKAKPKTEVKPSADGATGAQ